jgi:hypothetical protein
LVSIGTLGDEKAGELKAAALKRAGSVSWGFHTINLRSILDYHFRTSKLVRPGRWNYFERIAKALYQLEPQRMPAHYSNLPTVTIATHQTLAQARDSTAKRQGHGT